jgi:uncharacterized protein (TIGR02145 family)
MRVLIATILFVGKITICNGTIITALNSNEVQIGNQIWLNENLTSNKFQNGDELFRAENSFEWDSAFYNKIPAYMSLDKNKGENCFGFLYNEFAIKDNRIICPPGYRIPTIEDWMELFQFLQDSVGTKLKSTTGWDINDRSSNSTGFNAKPTGEAILKHGAFETKTSASFWYMNDDFLTGVIKLVSGYEDYGIPKLIMNTSGFMLRCIRN